MGTSPRSKSITAALEARLPLRLKGVLDPCLEAAVNHRRDAERAEFAGGFRDVHPPGRLGLPRLVVHHIIARLAGGGGVLPPCLPHPRGALALVPLRPPPNTDERVGVGAQHEPLERANRVRVARLRCPEDALPQIADAPV